MEIEEGVIRRGRRPRRSIMAISTTLPEKFITSLME